MSYPRTTSELLRVLGARQISGSPLTALANTWYSYPVPPELPTHRGDNIFYVRDEHGLQWMLHPPEGVTPIFPTLKKVSPEAEQIAGMYQLARSMGINMV
jgi:hypothetical protein